MKPLKVSEIVLNVGMMCNFTRKTAELFKTFRSVSRLWRDVAVYLFPTPHIDLADKASVVLSLCGDCPYLDTVKDVVCRGCIWDDDRMIELLNSYQRGVEYCLGNQKIRSQKLLEFCTQKGEFISFSSEANDITCDTLCFTDTNISRYTFDIDSIISNDSLCNDIIKKGHTISEWVGENIRTYIDTPQRVVLSRYLSNECVKWCMDMRSYIDLSRVIEHKSHEEMREFVLFTLNTCDLSVFASALKCRKFKEYVDVRRENSNIIISFEDLQWAHQDTDFYTKSLLNSWNSHDYLPPETINSLFDPSNPKDIFGYIRKLKSYTEYMRLLPEIRAIYPYSNCRVITKDAPIDTVLFLNGYGRVTPEFLVDYEGISLELLDEFNINKYEHIKILLLNPKFTARDVLAFMEKP